MQNLSWASLTPGLTTPASFPGAWVLVYGREQIVNMSIENAQVDKKLLEAAEVITLCHSDSHRYLSVADNILFFKLDSPDEASDDLDMLWVLTRTACAPAPRGGHILFSEKVRIRHVLSKQFLGIVLFPA